MFEFAVKRPVAVTVIMSALVILGIYFGMDLKLELTPTLDIPVVAIVTTYSGAGPSEVEEQVSKKIEDQVGTVENLKKITSRSQDNVSIVIAEFHYGTDMIQALSDVRDKDGKQIYKDIFEKLESVVKNK
ncbi:efflux RND transporter permease subunit [bacterium]|nr:efflux RND transporter permease subunit [bacterium]